MRNRVWGPHVMGRLIQGRLCAETRWKRMTEPDTEAVNVFRQWHMIATGGFLAKIRKLKLYGVPVNRFFEKNKSKK